MGELLTEAFQLYRMHLVTLMLTCAVLLVPASLAKSAAMTLILAPTAMVDYAARNTERLSQRAAAAQQMNRELTAAQGDPKKLEQLSRERQKDMEELSKSVAATGTAAVGGLMSMLLGFVAFMVSMAVIYGLAIPLTTGALTIIVADRVTGGNLTAGQAWRLLLGRLGRLLGATVPAFFLVLIGFFFLVLPGLVLSFLFVFVTPVVLLENVGGTSALKRSVALVKANAPQVFIVGVVFALIRMVATFVTHLFVSSTAFFFDSLVSDLVMMLLLPFPIAGTVLLYLDIRRQADGLDERVLREGIDGLRRS